MNAILKLTNVLFNSSYEPELHPGVTYKLYNPKATLKIFSTGGVTITGEETTLAMFLTYVLFNMLIFIGKDT